MKAKFPVSSFPGRARAGQFQRSSNASSGIALIGIIIAIIVMGLLGGGVLMLITTSSMESLQSLQWSKAFFAAETGVSAGKAYIYTNMSTNASWYTALPQTMTGMIGSASFTTVIATNDENNVVVSSTCVQGDFSRWTSRWSPEITRAIVVYKQGYLDFPRYRTCSNLKRLSDELTANDVTANVNWQRIEASPRNNEFLLVTQNSSRRIYAQTYANGTWGSLTYLNAAGVVPAAGQRGFDVAYESLSGRGMVVYSIGTPTPQYRLWSSNGWSVAMSMPVTVNDNISWIRLIARPNSDEIMCLARWRSSNRNYSGAIVWNGAAWINPVTLETACDSQIACETLDGAYSTNMALVVYVNGADLTLPKYRTYNSASGTWSGEAGMPVALQYEPRWIRVEYSADGALAYACFLTRRSSTRFYLQGAYWNGSAWGTTYNNFGNRRIETADRRCFDIAWSSQTNTLMVVASEWNQNAQSYMLETGGGISNQYGSLAPTDDGQWCVLKADPFTSEFYYLAQDAPGEDVNFQRWIGTEWSLFPVLETATANNNYNFTDFAFRRDSASTNCWPLR